MRYPFRVFNCPYLKHSLWKLYPSLFAYERDSFDEGLDVLKFRIVRRKVKRSREHKNWNIVSTLIKVRLVKK